MKEGINKGKEIIAQNTDLPSEIILDVPKITVIGYKEIIIENHKGILSFEKDLVRIRSKLGPIKIEGSGFEILYIGSSTINVRGKFKTIFYEEIHL